MDFEAEIRERVTKNESAIKSAHHRLDTQDKLIGSIHDIAKQILTLASEVKNLREDVNTLVNRVTILEDVPRSRYNNFITTAISAIVGGIIGIILTNIL